MTRLSWWSNAPWAPTGYGTQTAQVVRRLAAAGHQVALSVNYGSHGQMLEWEGVPVYPGGMDAYSQDVIAAHTFDWASRAPAGEPTALVTLFDTWILKCESLADLPVIASWVPIDHLPCPPDVLDWCRKPNVLPVAMARHGVNMLARAGVDCMYVPHAVETDVFRPRATLPSGTDPRELLGIGRDRFVVMINSANKGVSPCRKAFGEMFLAFSMFAMQHPEAVLYLHTHVQPGASGIDLLRLAQACGIRDDQVVVIDQYAYQMGVDPESLAAFYSMADVLLATSMGEGFGIPVIEAQACGTPVIVSDFTAQPELVGDGWKVTAQWSWDEPQRAWFGVPMVPEIVGSLVEAHRRWRNHPGPSTEAVRFVRENYDADVVFERHWVPVLDEIDRRLNSRPASLVAV